MANDENGAEVLTASSASSSWSRRRAGEDLRELAAGAMEMKKGVDMDLARGEVLMDEALERAAVSCRAGPRSIVSG